MAGRGGAFIEAGFAFPKPMIDIAGKTMIEVVVNNLRPKVPHRFIFVCLKEQYDKYDFYNIFKQSSKNLFEVVTINGKTEGAALTALSAIEHINNDEELLIANADQFIVGGLDAFIDKARKIKADGYILTFPSSHPRWSYARIISGNEVMEVAEKKVISNHATAGIYYYKNGRDFVTATQSMIEKNIRHNNEFYICPAYNEFILVNKKVCIHEIPAHHLYGLGTPEDLSVFQKDLTDNKINLETQTNKVTSNKSSKILKTPLRKKKSNINKQKRITHTKKKHKAKK